MTKKILKKITPLILINLYRRLKFSRNIKKDFNYDCRRFIRYNASMLKTKEELQAFIIKEYHAVEKGLALQNPKPWFGQARISMLIQKLRIYMIKYGPDSTTNITINTLNEYLAFNKSINQTNTPIKLEIEKILSEHVNSNHIHSGGTKLIKRSDVMETINFDFSKFVKSRHSTRDFSDIPVEREVVLSAIDEARFTPSVCNRQAWKVYLIDHHNKDLMKNFLCVQNGNSGFGEQISSLLIVAGKLSSFFEYERNQVFIDGGMFAMSIVYALHSKGLGTCCLNTSYTAQKQEEFLKVIPLDVDIVPIMFIAIGNLKEEYKVAYSQRKHIEDIVTLL